MTYESDVVESELRTAIQDHDDVAYIFLGSRKHLLRELTFSQGRPLYKIGSHYVLSAIGNEHWVPFIQEKFSHGGKVIEDAEILYLLRFSEAQPNTTQQFCYELWEKAEKGTAITTEQIDSIITKVLKQENFSLQAAWRDFSSAEKELLKKLAHEEPFEESDEDTAKGLYQNDVVDYDENNKPYVVDRIQKLWVRQKFPRTIP